MSIHFGTSGWRAIVGKEFNASNVRKVCLGIVEYLKAQRLQHKGLIVGHDTRFMSREFAKICARTFANNGISIFLTNRDTPTPVIAFQILKKNTAGAINITASHNPPEYNGIKFSPAYGGPAPLEVTGKIERNIQRSHTSWSGKKGLIRIFDPRPAYLRRIKQLVDFGAIRKSRLKIGVDLLYGTGRGYLDQLLKDAGCKITVLHNSLDPLFGGLPPEPAKAQLKKLINLVKTKHLHLGLAVDGDADRFGIVDRDGTFIGANQVIGLLTEHLIRTRPRKKTVARTVATTHLVDALAQRQGLKVVETPVGFKYIGRQIAKGNCLIGGEESGGLSVAGHLPEKDGILACLLIAELVAIRKKSLSEILKELYKEVGPFFSARENFPLKAKEKTNFAFRIKSLAGKPSLSGKRIVKFVGLDGYKFIFANGSWLMFRVSGTEPVVRCYCETKSRLQLKDLQRLGRKLIKQEAKKK